jgi:hypothetical protein
MNYIDIDGQMSERAWINVRNGINDLGLAVSSTAHAHGWWNDNDGNKIDRNMGEMIALMHSELSEALESHRNSEPDLWYQYEQGSVPVARNGWNSQPSYPPIGGGPDIIGKPCGIASEFADVIIRILDTCYTLDIPIASALRDKAEYNRTRPYRHGGKTC